MKRRKTLSCEFNISTKPITVLPGKYKDTVRSHINSVYVGTITQIYDPAYSDEEQLATAHWFTDQGLFVTLHDEQRSDFVTLKYKTFVVEREWCLCSNSSMLTETTSSIQAVMYFVIDI